MVFKKELASRIVDLLNSEGSGAAALSEWEHQFSRKEKPKDIQDFMLKKPSPFPTSSVTAA